VATTGGVTRYYVYILSNGHGTLYVGVTNNLRRRVLEHRRGLVAGFTRRYNLHRLVYFESTPDPLAAIAREKEIKGWSRARKVALVQVLNPGWRDLAEDLG
jgi:putative endonuclease